MFRYYPLTPLPSAVRKIDVIRFDLPLGWLYALIVGSLWDPFKGVCRGL